MDVIFISELRLDFRIGVYDREQRVAQKIQLDLEIGLPRGRPASERLEDTIDYAAVVARIEALAADRFALLENLAERIASLVLEDFGAPWVRVSVAKLAPLRNVRRLGLTIERGVMP